LIRGLKRHHLQESYRDSNKLRSWKKWLERQFK